MAPGIAVIMVVGTGALVAAAWWLIEAVAPRKMAERTARQIALHRDAVAALEIAVANVGTDAAHKARLTVSLEWHRSALAALAPDAAAALPADLKLAA
jgi:hypothetical protein